MKVRRNAQAKARVAVFSIFFDILMMRELVPFGGTYWNEAELLPYAKSMILLKDNVFLLAHTSFSIN